jgi:biotin carboxyl carrier protein
VRAISGAEVRINATNSALQPHAGGLIRTWSEPIEGEIRFDQGIGLRNPDTGAFVYYNLAGAYDSNIALILCEADNRRANLAAMAEILRRMELRGDDLQTNAPVHYGLTSWFLGRGHMAEPTTRFMGPYLGAVGALQELVAGLDLDTAWEELLRRQPDAEARAALAAKQTLLLRPLQRLFANVHLLAGFVGRFDGELFAANGGPPRFLANPLATLAALYHFLDLDWTDAKPASEKIWDHDRALLGTGQSFYAALDRKLGALEWSELFERLDGERDPRVAGDDEALWRSVRAAHRGHQLGLELLLLPARIAQRSGFSKIRVGDDLQVVFPPEFLDADAAARHARALAPAPRASADEIVAPMGGTFYAREAPHLPLLVEVGGHFEAGQPLFIIEVMKMFNKILAPFAGTVTATLMEGRDATVVKKGQPIFKIEPDERVVAESPENAARRRHESTLALLSD